MITITTKILDNCGIAYTLKRHVCDALTCAEVAHERGLRLSQVLKCMVGKDNFGKIYIMMIPGNKTLKMKKMRRIVGNGRLDLIPADELTIDYGLKIGGISPFHFLEIAKKGKARFYLDQNVLHEEYIDISSGQLNAGVLLRTNDILDLLKPHICDITSNTSAINE
jgi:Cys-tRNA(Pro) deacylase